VSAFSQRVAEEVAALERERGQRKVDAAQAWLDWARGGRRGPEPPGVPVSDRWSNHARNDNGAQ